MLKRGGQRGGFFAILAIVGVACSTFADEFPLPHNTEKATDAPMPPDEVCRTAKLPPGFELSVFAAEPDVQNPIGIAFDERGRLWVAENYTYAGTGFDTALRDRVIILEDSDGDGKHDRRTVFWDQGQRLTSVEVGYGGTFVLCAPQLLFIPDKNRDDVPDGPPEVLLDGFAAESVAHNVANGLRWGPDGWLYGRQGILETAFIGPPGATESQRVKINTGIWRYHPTRHVVEDVMHGMTNSWGFDYDQHGEMFCINTVIGHLWHIVPGARTERMFGVDFNPHAYQLIKPCSDHVHWDTGENWRDAKKGLSNSTDAAGGGHAHSGLLIYQGDNWPEAYRHKAYTLNMHGRRINCDRIERQGAGFVAKHEPDFAFFADPWFRGLDLITGPDGGVYIADWSDTGECHDSDGVHRTSGRIYKLTYGKPQPVAPFNLATLPLPQLRDLLAGDNTWFRRAAAVELNYRLIANPADGAKIALASAVLPTDENSPAQLVRSHLNEFAELAKPLSRQVCDELLQLAQHDPDGPTCLYLAAALQRMEVADRWPLAQALAAEGRFADDRMFPIMLWLGIEPAVASSPARAVALAQMSQVPLLTQNIARRLTLEIERDPAAVEQLLDAAIRGDAIHSHEIVLGMGHALKGWRKAPMPANWTQAATKFSNSEIDEVKQAVGQLNLVFGDGVALDELNKLAFDENADSESRRQALRSLISAKPEGFAPKLQSLLRDRAVLIEALRGLALYDDDKTPEQILSAINFYSSEARAEMVNTLAARPEYANALLAAVQAGSIQRGEVTAFHARQILGFNRDDLMRQLIEVWGEIRISAADKRALIENWKHQLSPEVLAKANLSAGRAQFEKSCGNCHVLYGVGRKVGPDLTGSHRSNLDFLLENIFDPSATVASDFRAVSVALNDGRVLSGVIGARSDRTITLITDRDTLTLDREEIDQLQPTPNSLMPDGLLTILSDEQVRDLIAYLMSPQQVPLAE